MSRVTVQTTKAEEVLAPELIEFISEWKTQPGNLIMVLHRVQEHYGYVPRKVAFAVADLLEIRWHASTVYLLL